MISHPLPISYDKEADAAYVSLSGEPVIRTEEVSSGTLVDYDSENRPVGVEVLSLEQRVGSGDRHSYLLGLTEGLLSQLVIAAA